jgi:hypothetical protein
MRIAAIALPVLAAILSACVAPSTGTGGVGGPSLASTTTATATGSPGAVTPGSPVPAPTSSMPSEEPIMPFTLTSTAFAEGGSIPREYTCDADDVSPPLAWTGLPEGSAALALVVDDPDAGGFVHWVVYDIDPAVAGLAEGASTAPGAPAQGRNSFGQTGYGGPCPPSGTHHYLFRLLALDQELGLSGTPDAASVLAAADGHILEEARLTGTYTRG